MKQKKGSQSLTEKEDSMKETKEQDESMEPRILKEDSTLVNCKDDDEFWRDSQPSLIDKLQHAFHYSNFTDAEVIAKDGEVEESFKVHRLIFAIQSPTFKRLFFGEKSTKRIVLDSVKPRVFRYFVKYVYSDDSHITNLSLEDLLGLWSLSRKCQTVRLTEILKKKLLSLLEAHKSAALPILQKALGLKDVEMQKVALKVIERYGNSLLTDSSLSAFDEGTVKAVLSLDSLDVSEIRLWDLMVKWGNVQCSTRQLEADASNLRMVLKDVIQEVRFVDMEAEEFSEGPEKSGIINTDERVAIKRKITDPIAYSMPSPFSASKRRRKS